jgi:hypothetical protein
MPVDENVQMAERLRAVLDRLPDETKVVFALALDLAETDGPEEIGEVGQDFLRDSRRILLDRGGEVLPRLGFDPSTVQDLMYLSLWMD